MSAKPSLDALRIDRGAPPPRRGPGFLIAAVVLLGIVAIAAGTYYFWPAPAVPVQAVTATGSASGGSGGLDATGYVVARRMATLSSKILGKMVEINVEEGQRVEKGQIVARLDDSNYLAALGQAQALERQAKLAFEDATPIFTRYQRLREQNAVSVNDFETQRAAFDAARSAHAVASAAVALAQAQENDTTIRAPFAGMVTDKAAQVGEIVAPAAAGGGLTRTGIATIVDMDSLEVEVDVSENYIERVRPNGPASITLDAYPDWEIPANVIAVIPTADLTKGTVKVRIGFKQKDNRILPQMGARVTFHTENLPQAAPVASRVTVPPQAVEARGKTGTLFVIGDGDVVQKREVALGLQTSQAVTVLSGIAPGDRIAASNLDKLRDGMKVQIQE